MSILTAEFSKKSKKSESDLSVNLHSSLHSLYKTATIGLTGLSNNVDIADKFKVSESLAR